MSLCSKARARRLQRCIESLEVRQLLAVQFNIAAGSAPPGRTDIATGMANGNTETAIAIDRSDPIQLAISNQGALLTTQDFGANFNGPLGYGGIINGTGLPGVGGDPDLTFDSQGRLFWTNLAQNGTPPRSVAIAEINPANATQQAGTNVAFVPWNNGNSFDKQSMAADDDVSGTSPYADRIYVVYTELSGTDFVQFSRSTDNGQTFSNPLNLSLNTETNAGGVTPVWPADITVDADGDIYAAYHYQPGVTATTAADGRANSDGTSGTIFLLRSTNGGTSFPTKTTPFPAGTADISLNVQSVPGTIPNHRFWLQGAMEPVVLADPARPGNVYVIAMDDPDNNHGSGDDGDIVIARSTNNGSTWSRSTISAGPNNSLQFMPTAAIDEFGTLVVAWYDDRNGTVNGNGDRTVDVRATYSTDGGLSWVSSFQLNDVTNPITPVTAGTNVRFFGADIDNDGSTNDLDGDETFRFGEYFDIDVFGGTAYVTWNGNTFTAGNPTNHQAWFQSFAIDGSLSVTADEGSVTDSIVIQSIAANGDYFEVLVDGNRQYAGLWESIASININAGDGNDTITINDLPSTCNVILLGGEGNDTLNLGDDDFDTQIRGDVLMSGGNGTDRVVLDDSADTGNDTWRIDDDTFSKTSGTGSLIAQGGTEQVQITGSNGAIDYRVGSLASAISVTIFGGTGGDELFLADTTHDIDTNVAGNLFFGASTGTDRIWFDDEADGLGSDSYTIGGTSFVKTLVPVGAIDYSSVELLDLVASPNSDTINIENIAANQEITINAGSGNDTIAVGAGDFDNEINGPVSVLGEAGDDLLRINDSLDTLADDYTISSGDFTKSSEATGIVRFKPAGFATLPDIDRIELIANDSANDIYLNGLGGSVANPFPNPPTTVAVDVTIIGGDGDDRMYIADSGKLLASLRGNITVTGTGGNDELFINDFNSSSNDIHTLSGADYSKNTWAYDVLFSAEELTLQTGTGNDQVNATNVNAAITLLGGAGNDDYSLEGNYAGIATVVDGEAGLDDIDVNLDGAGSTLVNFINNQDLDLLNIGDGGLVSLAPTHLLLDVVGTLIGGKIDLRNGAMIDRDTALVNPYRTHIINGYNNGNWLGGEPSITSSYAAASVQLDGLGYGYAQEIGTVPFNFLGTPVNNGDLLIRYTLYGDANLSGVVNSIDFNFMVAGYGMTSNADWVDGDFDYNCKSNTIDFNFLAGNFGAAAPGPIFGAVVIEGEDDSLLA
jgi:hypothetical protein